MTVLILFNCKGIKGYFGNGEFTLRAKGMLTSQEG
jgi:hypothetical protein